MARLGLLLALCARLAVAQGAASAPAPVRATVSGLVRDSLSRAPLVGAMVQLASADSNTRLARTVRSDTIGWYRFDDVPDGRYRLAFLHPMLDSLGLEPTVREVEVARGQSASVDLATPSPASYRAAVCGAKSASYAGSVVMGVVRDAERRAPLPAATVTGEWIELSFTPAGTFRRLPSIAATTGEGGWFALCDVPSPGTMTLLAHRGPDSTDAIEVQVPADGFLRRELYLGPARTVLSGDTARRLNAIAPPPRRIRTGDVRLRGIVVTGDSGPPVAGALVGTSEGPQTRTNERGEWTLANAPAGTRMLEVRAVGFYPERRPVEVLPDAAPVRVSLSTLDAVLDTVFVTAARFDDPHRSGFAQRLRSGLGRYLTARDIVRRQPIVTSDLFRSLPGVFVEEGAGLDTRILMRGIFEARCVPAFYLNGRLLDGPVAGDIDILVRPRELAAIEVYAGTMVPAEFQPGLTGCGSIVIWTK